MSKHQWWPHVKVESEWTYTCMSIFKLLIHLTSLSTCSMFMMKPIIVVHSVIANVKASMSKSQCIFTLLMSCYQATAIYTLFTANENMPKKFWKLGKEGSLFFCSKKIYVLFSPSFSCCVFQCLSHMLWISVYYETYTDGRNKSPVAETDTNSIFKILWLNPLLVLGSSIVSVVSSASLSLW